MANQTAWNVKVDEFAVRLGEQTLGQAERQR